MVCVKGIGRGSVLGILLLLMPSSSFGGIGGPEIWDSPEMIELLPGSGVGCVDHLVIGDGVSVLMGQMCCLLHLDL